MLGPGYKEIGDMFVNMIDRLDAHAEEYGCKSRLHPSGLILLDVTNFCTKTLAQLRGLIRLKE